MKKQFSLIRLLLYCGGFLFSLSALHAASPAPTLSVQSVNAQSVQLTWPSTALGFELEEAFSVGNAISWQAVNRTPVLNGNQFTLSVTASATAQFFRLRLPDFTSIESVSPADGETGVAVTRETIVYFSGPLATNAVVKTNNLYAVSAGRRILSRVEMSSDRAKVTLFYLEPLPGSARVNVFFDGAGLTDALGRPIDPAGDGIPFGLKVFSFDTLSLTALQGTAVIGTVYASELVPGSDTGTNAMNQPLAGVTITVDGMEQSLRAVTDATGKFTLSPVPPGRFFVHIDGRTVTNAAAGIRYPNQSYYPAVGKAWDAVAGVTNNLAGGTGTIFLPLIKVGTLQPVSMTSDTMISFLPSVVSSNPALAGVSITVPANSLFSDDGTRGGKVGITPVPPDRLPGPLPPGLEMPLVITVQTDGGLNFDKPVPICFPNLPNPTTGKAWPPGTKGSLISFNHDKGVWEDVGDMTVSADGKFFCTDPGVGILQPGWHGPLCPKASKPPPPPPPNRCLPLRTLTIETCTGACQNQFELCESEARGYVLEAKRICEALSGVSAIGLTNVVEDCLTRAYLTALDQRAACQREDTECRKFCVSCVRIAGRSSQIPDPSLRQTQLDQLAASRRLVALHGIDPVSDQLTIISEQIAELVRPFIFAHLPIPQGVFDQINFLYQQANAVAGGDAAGYLTSRAIAAEDQNAASAIEIGLEPDALNPGNAPPYPILYAARVLRPNALFIIRGETQPFGQYTLFLPPDGKLLDVSFYDPKSKEFALIFPNLSPKAPYRLPRFNLFPLLNNTPDSDQDGLPDLVEDVYGTIPTKADTDGDGIPDGAEIEQGTDPLGGLAVRTGVIATVKTPGAAIDIATGNDLAVVAQGASGVAVLNIAKITQPTIIVQVDTPGTAQRVAFSGNLVAVADGNAGLAVIDISDPVTARIIHQVNLSGAQAVAVGNGIGYVGLNSGAVFAVDLANGVILNQVNVTNAVQDVTLEGDHLYALTADRLIAISLADSVLRVVGGAASPFAAAMNQRLFVGGGIAYTTHRNGYNTLDVVNPARPILLAAGNTTQFGWRQIVPNGSGLGLAAVAPNSTDSFPRDVSLYDVSNPRMTDVAITTFPTPGNARAVSIFNGLAYVADDTSGMQVVNYLPYDAKGLPPTITLTTSFSTNRVEEGKPARVTANVSDDVQVRNVEFYLDGVKTFTDAAFPFEFRFVTPRRAADKTSFRLRARAVDTGGNFTWTGESTVSLLPDTTPPRVTQYAPLAGAKALRTVTAYFDGPMDSATLNPSSFKLFSAGNDGQLGTADDLLASGGSTSYQAELQAAYLTFALPLPDGLYRAVVTTAVADLAGNRLASDYTWQFRVADAVFWIKTTDGLWSDPLNWSTRTLPGTNDHVIIELGSVDVTVTHAAGTTAIKSLLSNERLVVTGGILQVPGGLQINKDMTLNGGTIRGGRVTQNDGARLIIANNGGNTLDGVSLNAGLDLTGARLRILNGLTLSGSVLLDIGGTLTFAGDQTFDNASIIFVGTSGTLGVEDKSTLTLGPNAVVRGRTGTIGQTLIAGQANKLINRGLISADVTGGTITIQPAVFENTGTVETKNGGNVTLRSVIWSNSSLITAVGGALTLDGSFTNTGTIQANNATVNLDGDFTRARLGAFQRTGGTVKLAGVLNLTGETLALNATTGSWTLDRGTINGGTLTASNGARLVIVNNIPSTLDGVTLNGDLDVTSQLARVFIRNGLTLNGSVLLDRGGTITFIGNQTLAAGSIVFGGVLGGGGIFPNTLTIQDNNTTLTLGPAVVVRGQAGTINGNGNLLNQGLISADVAGGTLSIDARGFTNAGTSECRNGGSLVIGATTWNNAGVINAAGAGALTLADAWTNAGTINASGATVNLDGTFTLAQLGTLNRTGGTVKVTGVLNLAGDTLALNASTGSWQIESGTINGGTVTASDGARLICVGNPGSTLNGVTLNGDLDVTTTLARVFIRNGLKLSGSVLLDRGGTITFIGNQTLATGSIVFGGVLGGGIFPNTLTIQDNNTTLTLGLAVVVRGQSGTINGNGNLLNQGLISADVAGGTLRIDPGQFINTGTLEEKNGGKIVIIP